jgi:branched-chain amino acid transport system ATP-binding protein
LERLDTERDSDAVVANGDGRVPLLAVEQLQAGWGRKHVVYDVDLHVYEGEIVGILGHNGSGKSTTIKAILGTNPAMGGKAVYAGRDVTRAGSKSNVRAGMALIPSERFVFADLTVLDNLLLGGANIADASRRAERLELVYELFPILRDRSTQPAGTLSGGQQRMVSLGLALMSGPKLLMLDEPSLGWRRVSSARSSTRSGTSPTPTVSRCCCSSRTSPRRCASSTASTSCAPGGHPRRDRRADAPATRTGTSSDLGAGRVASRRLLANLVAPLRVFASAP